MSSVSAVNSGEGFSLLALPLTLNGPLDRIFSYVGIQGLGSLSSVCRQIHAIVVDSGEKSSGSRLWRDTIESEMARVFHENSKRWSVIDHHVWKSSPQLSAFLKENHLEAPYPLSVDCYKRVLTSLKTLNALKIERNAGMTYIAMPTGITFRMLSTLLAQALGQPTCFARPDHNVPATYWDTPVSESYAYAITNSVILNSKNNVLEIRVEIIEENDCEVIEGINHLALLALTYVVTKERSTNGVGVSLYPYIPSTLTCVRINDLFFEMGDFFPTGLCIFFGGRNVNLGAGAQWVFGPLGRRQYQTVE